MIAWVLEFFFPYFRWARRLLGGHWELWWVDFPVCSYVWHRVNSCTTETGKPPSGLCRGGYECEDYRSKAAK